MALYHFWQAFMGLLFGAGTWVMIRIVVLQAHNYYVTEFPQWAAMPHVGFMLAVTQWGLWLLVMLPVAVYLWANTQRPEDGA